MHSDHFAARQLVTQLLVKGIGIWRPLRPERCISHRSNKQNKTRNSQATRTKIQQGTPAKMNLETKSLSRLTVNFREENLAHWKGTAPALCLSLRLFSGARVGQHFYQFSH
jgi:hypothetical protein